MKLTIVFIFIFSSLLFTIFSTEAHSGKKKFKSSFYKKLITSRKLKNSQEEFDIKLVLNTFKEIIKFPGYKMAEQEGSCSKNGMLPDFTKLGDFGKTFGSIFSNIAERNKEFTQCFGNYSFAEKKEITDNLVSNVKLCKRLPLKYGTTYSILATDFGKNISICAAFTSTGTFAISISSAAVKAFDISKKDKNLFIDILFTLNKVLLNNPIDLGVSFNRELQVTSRLPVLESFEKEETNEITKQVTKEVTKEDGSFETVTQSVTEPETESITSYRTAYDIKIKKINHLGHIFFYLPKKWNPLNYIPNITKNIRDAVVINTSIPVLIDFGPISPAFGEFDPSLRSLTQVLGGDFSKVTSLPNIFKDDIGKFFENTIIGIEIVTSISGEIIITIPNIQPPIVLKTKNLSLFIKSSDADFGTGIAETGLYLNIPPEAHEQFHKLLKDGLKNINIELADKPSLNIGLMFTATRFGIIIDFKDLGITWKCSTSWTGPSIFLSPDCGLHIK